MTFFPSSELLLDPSPLRVSDTTPGQLARSTARELAAQRSRAPRPFVTAPRGAGVAGFALAVANEAWNLALNQNIPVATPDFDIPGTLTTESYLVNAALKWKDRRPPPFDLEDTAIVQDFLIDGIILSLGMGTVAGFTALRQVRQNADGSTVVILITGRNPDFWEFLGLQGLSVRRVAQPTIDLPGSFPGTDPFAPPADPLGIPITITLPGGLSGQPLPIVLPLRIPNPSSLGERPVPILYDPTIPEERRRYLPQMWLTPTGIQVGSGTPGDPVVITVGEVPSNLTTPTDTSDYRQRNPPTVTTCLDTPEPPVDCCSCEEIRDIVFEELDKKLPPKRPTTLVESIQPAGESGTFVLPAFTQWIELRIVTTPPNVRMQTGGTLAPEVRYNGWYSFGATGEASERIPFHYDSISILVPPKTSAFSYTVYSGGTAQATIGYLLPAP